VNYRVGGSSSAVDSSRSAGPLIGPGLTEDVRRIASGPLRDVGGLVPALARQGITSSLRMVQLSFVGPYFGNGIPPPLASTDDAAERAASAATVSAAMRGRIWWARPWNMAPAPFGAGARTPRTGYAASVRKSTIAKHSKAGTGSAFARALGNEIRHRRRELGLTQETVARPMGRAFLSLVERGRLTPSLGSLLIIAQRLDTSAAEILRSVDAILEEP
jgi:DNA-binding XRE family transcriptional regulator